MKPYAEGLSPEIRVADANDPECTMPARLIAYELDDNPFDVEQKQAIIDGINSESKFIVIGECSALQETKNRAMIIFFSGEGVSHEDFYKHMRQVVSNKYFLKDAGIVKIVDGKIRLTETSLSLDYILLDDPTIQTKWRMYLERNSGLEVGSNIG